MAWDQKKWESRKNWLNQLSVSQFLLEIDLKVKNYSVEEIIAIRDKLKELDFDVGYNSRGY